MARVWDDLLSDLDRAVYAEAGYGARGGAGERPSLLVVDVTYDFVGDKPEPILESIRKFPASCGEAGWRAMHRIRELLDVCRELRVPVFYTTGMDDRSATTVGSWAWKNTKTIGRGGLAAQIGNRIPELIAPVSGETVIPKSKPSALFGTPLLSYLIGLKVDTVLVAGSTTSGCVRGTVVDLFCHNFHIIVAEDAVFDRCDVAHRVNLFDMNAKYADVISTEDARTYLLSLRPASAASR